MPSAALWPQSLDPWMHRWLQSAAARCCPKAGPEPEPAALAPVALLLRTAGIVAHCKKAPLKQTQTAAWAGDFARRPSLAGWQRLLRLDEAHSAVQRLARVLEDTAWAAALLALEPAAAWLELAARWLQLAQSPFQPHGLEAVEALYLHVLQQHAGPARQLHGQFYTPPHLVQGMWQLGWAQWQRLAANPALVVDPCSGSGAFLRHPASTPPGGSCGLRVGFELQALPRSLARLHAWADPNTHILGVNALTHSATADGQATPLGATGAGGAPGLPHSAPKPPEAPGPRFVIGNPPWRNPSPALRDRALARWLREALMPYAWRYESVDLASLRGCVHGVREDSVFFLGRTLRWLQPQGVAVLVTPDSWLDAPTYTLVRRYLLDTTRVHTVLRLGACFPGVRERAAVVVLSRGYEAAGRAQSIDYFDSSRASHCHDAIGRVAPAAGRAQSTDCQDAAARATPMQVEPQSCQLRPAAVVARRGAAGRPRVALHSLFTASLAGAQSGCGPLFLAPERATVEARMALFFAQPCSPALAQLLAPQLRGGLTQAQALLQRVERACRAHGATYRPAAVRRIWAHFRGRGGAPAVKQGWCYFDARLWLFPRVPRQGSARCFWDIEPKLLFRDVYDPHDKPIAGVVDAEGWVCDNHVFNGGTRVATVRAPDGRSLLSDVGHAVRQRFADDISFLQALARCLNAAPAQRWGQAHPRQALAVELAHLRA